MLPSTGLFQSILCPHFDSQKSCTRPFCHFKHAKKDEESPEVPVYVPTPKVLPKLLTLDNSPIKKKSKLEYIPTKPEINDVPINKIYTPKSNEVPVYIPWHKNDSNGEEKENEKRTDLNDGSEDFEIQSDLFAKFSDDEEENLEIEVDADEETEQDNKIDGTVKEKQSNEIDNKTAENGVIDTKKDKLLKEAEQKNQCPLDKEKFKIKKPISIDNTLQKPCTEIEKKEKRHRHDSHSSSKDKDNKKSRDKHKSSGSREKDKRKHKEKDRSHSGESRHSSSSKSSNKNSSSSKPHNNHHSSHSSRSSRHKSSHRSKESVNKTKSVDGSKNTKTPTNTEHKKVDLLEVPLSQSVTYSDDDDVMEQCKQIFEEFNNTHPKVDDNTEANQKNDVSKKRRSIESVDEISNDDVIKKKRVAHEGAAVLTFEAPIVRKPNHVQSAFQSVYARQELLQKNQKEKEAAAFALVKEAEEKLREAEENLRKATMTQKNHLTPLIPKSYLTPPKIAIKPIINYLALEKAKKKVEEMRKLKGPTLAQSVTKGANRVAHNPCTSRTATGTNSNEDKAQNQPAPPVLEPNSTKISYNIRMQHYNQMVKYCLDIYPKCDDAWERAQTEELAVFKKCCTPIIYRSSAVLTINKLRKESIAAGNVCTQKNKTISHEVILAGKFASNVSVNKKNNPTNPFDRISSEKLYKLISELTLNDEQLVANGFPRPGPKRGTAVVNNTRRQAKANREDERICRRCSKTFNIEMYDHEAIDECCYHPKGTGYRRGFTDNYHHCCQQPAGSPGCTYANYHVTDNLDYNNLKGFVQTIDKPEDYSPTKKDIFALDCEMCYTTEGIELTRVTVVNFEEKVVYDALVKPENKIIDYNTVFSGITEELLRNEKRTIRDVQAILLSMFNSKTILIGHSLESDMKALKLIHSCVVDTSVLYPHKMGPPKKRALKNLCIENLKRIIQEDEGGHNSAEDAEVCIALVKHYLKIKIN